MQTNKKMNAWEVSVIIKNGSLLEEVEFSKKENTIGMYTHIAGNIINNGLLVKPPCTVFVTFACNSAFYIIVCTNRIPVT